MCTRVWRSLSAQVRTGRWLLSVGLVLFLLAGHPGGSSAQAPGTDQSLIASLSFADRDQPIDIRSQRLEFLYAEKRVQYQDGVVATQGEVTLTCNLLTVSYEEPAESDGTPPAASTSSQQRLTEIIAEGDVRLESESGYATGRQLVFDQIKRTVTLSGDAVLHEGANQVSGDRVIVYLDERRSVVEGQARMRLIPGSNDTGTTAQ